MSLFDSYRAPKPPRGEEPQVLRVAELARTVRATVESMGELWVEGEVIDFTRSAAGHLYFTLSDPDEPAQARCVMFRSDAMRAGAKLGPGARVRVRARPTLYEQRGTFQLVVSRATLAGEGDLAARLEQLKKKLEAEGLFATERKRALPRLPRVVGVVTSTTGAALHDVLRVSEGRCPVRIVVADCRVQGEGALVSIVAALALVQKVPDLDVVIVGRGGGSAEDLVAFQDESVIRAIASCRVPIVSAVGHETDVTIADLVADVRAATPSNAAELVVPDRRLLERELESARRQLERAMDARIDGARASLERRSRLLGDPRGLLASVRRRLEPLSKKLEQQMARRLGARRTELVALDLRLHDANPRHALARQRSRLVELRTRLDGLGRTLTSDGRSALGAQVASLDALSPLAVLVRGYAIALGPDGRALVDSSRVSPGDSVSIRLARGRVDARVEATVPDPIDAKSDTPDSR